MNLRGLFRRRKRVDQGAYDRAASLPIPEGTSDVPFDTRLPLTPATTIILSHASFLLVVFGFGFYAGAVRPTALELAGISGALLLIIVSSVLRGGLNPDRRLHVSGEGIRVDRLFGTKSVPWWNVTGVLAMPDLSEFRVDAKGGGITIQTAGLNEDGRAATLLALRARLSADGTLGPWRRSRLNRGSVANTAGAIGSILLLGSFYLSNGIGGGALGVRCSGPSSYFDSRFGLPPRESGCVVLRVSGAAARAGVRQGDRMISMNGVTITSGEQFNAVFGDARTSQFDFTFKRSGVAQPISLHVTLGPSSSPTTPDTDPLAWFLRARGNPSRQQSIDQYSRAIELAPEFDLAYVFRGELELEHNDFGTAVPDLQQALSLNPESAETNRALASYYEGQIFTDPTVPKLYIQRAIEIHACDNGFTDKNLDCEEDYVVLADLLRFRTDTAGSIDAAKRAIPFYPKAAEPLYQLALSYEIAHDKVAATSFARQYLSSRGSDRTDSRSATMRALLARVANPTAVPSR